MLLTSTTAFDALRHDIMTQCGSFHGPEALESACFEADKSPLHKISSRNSCLKLYEKLWLGTDRQASGCWAWERTLLPNGYGQLSINGRKHYLHRIFYLLTYGPIGEGLQIDHLCRNRACCRPDHLEAVTCRENILRGQTIAAFHARKTHCIKGHPFASPNLYISRYRRKGVLKTTRTCRTCAGLPLRQTPGAA